MDYNTWFSLLRKQLDAVTAGLAGNASEAKFLDIVKELARKPDLVAGKDKNMLTAILCLILAGAASTGEIIEVADLLEIHCCNESAPFNIEIIRKVVETFTEQ